MTDSTSLRFLLVDHNADGRGLLAQALRREFPRAIFLEARDGDAAISIVSSEPLAAIISHRTLDYDGEILVAFFRRMNREVPIIMVSGYDHSARALAAGADAFLNYDEWQRIPAVVADVMATRSGKTTRAKADDVPLSVEPALEPI